MSNNTSKFVTNLIILNFLKSEIFVKFESIVSVYIYISTGLKQLNEWKKQRHSFPEINVSDCFMEKCPKNNWNRSSVTGFVLVQILNILY